MSTSTNIIRRRGEQSGSEKRHVLLLAIFISVLLLSLMINVRLAFFYFKLPQCSPVTLSRQTTVHNRNCSSTELGGERLCYKDKCYVLSRDKMNWTSSRESCKTLGGDLVIITSTEEHELFAGLLSNTGTSLYWIGLTDAENEDVWLWIDGTPLNKNLSWWKYTPDDYTKDDPLGEDCVVYYEGKWADVSCLTSQKRICEIYCSH